MMITPHFSHRPAPIAQWKPNRGDWGLGGIMFRFAGISGGPYLYYFLPIYSPTPPSSPKAPVSAGFEVGGLVGGSNHSPLGDDPVFLGGCGGESPYSRLKNGAQIYTISDIEALSQIGSQSSPTKTRMKTQDAKNCEGRP